MQTNAKEIVSSGPLRLAQAAEGVTKISIAVIGSAYVVGLVIQSVHVMNHGLYYLNFLQVEYVFAGLLWGFLTGATYLYGHLLARGIRHIWQRKRSVLARVAVVVWFAFSALIILVGTVSVFLTSADRKTKTIASVVGILIFNATAVRTIGSSAGSLFGWASAINKRVGPSEMLSFLLGLIFALSFYGKYAFPKLVRQFGGGNNQQATLLVKKEKVEVLQAMGFPIDAAKRSCEVKIIFEGADFFFAEPPPMAIAPEAKGVRISKDFFDAIYYTPERFNPFGL